MNAPIPQLPVTETAHDGQSRPALALRNDSANRSVNDAEKPSSYGEDHLPNVRRTGIAGAAVQRGHWLRAFHCCLTICSMHLPGGRGFQGRMSFRPETHERREDLLY
jgi:hypothetical protein